VIPVQRADLKFGTSAILVELNVKPGSEVKEGQILARIETTSLEKALEEKKAELTIAQDNLEEALEPYSELELIEARLAVMNARIAAEEAKEKLARVQVPDVLAKQLAVSDALLALEEAKKNLTETQMPDVVAKQLAVSNTLLALEEAKENLDKLLHPDIQSAQIAVRNATVAYENAQRDLVTTQKSKIVSENVRQREYEHSWYEGTYGEALKKFERGEISKAELDGHWGNLMGAKERLDTARAEAATALASAELRVQQTREALAKAQAELASLWAGPEAVELERARLQVSQAEVNLKKAREDLAEAEAQRASLQAGGDIVALDRARLQVAQAEANLAKAKGELAKAKAGPSLLELAKAQAEVTRTLLTVQKAELELAKMEAGPDPKAVELARARLTTAQAEVDKAQAQLRAATMVAPFAGVVVAVSGEVGETVSANAVVLSVANLRKLMVKAIVNEVNMAKLKIGQEARITFDALPGQRFSGTVFSLPLEGTLVQNILNYEVPVMLDYEGGSLRPGMTANVTIVADTRRDVLLVPLVAIQYDARGGAFVALQRSAEVPIEHVPVSLGVTEGTSVEVVSGLSQGDRVVITFKSAEEAAGFTTDRQRQAVPGMVPQAGSGQKQPFGR